MPNNHISAIVPTIGRPDSLKRLLKSLADQSLKPEEVIVADGSGGEEITAVVENNCWVSTGLKVNCIQVYPPNAVRQRIEAIAISSGEYLLFLDDDVELEPSCLEQMWNEMLSGSDIVAVSADFSNQSWPNPTAAWRLYLRFFYGLRNGEWQGRILGPLLRFGYNPRLKDPMPMEWLGTCNTLVRRAVYDKSGGFSDFFLHRCTMNEDVDLGIKVKRYGRILLLPSARLAHYHAPTGRVSSAVAAEDDIHNRYMVLNKTLGYGCFHAFGLVVIYISVESISDLLASIKRLNIRNMINKLNGRIKALFRILNIC